MKNICFLLITLLLVSTFNVSAQKTVKSADLSKGITMSGIKNSDTKMLFRESTDMAVGVSCSSKDGTQDCFCTGGCRRTQSSCSCTGLSVAGEVIETQAIDPGR